MEASRWKGPLSEPLPQIAKKHDSGERRKLAGKVTQGCAS